MEIIEIYRNMYIYIIHFLMKSIIVQVMILKKQHMFQQLYNRQHCWNFGCDLQPARNI